MTRPFRDIFKEKRQQVRMNKIEARLEETLERNRKLGALVYEISNLIEKFNDEI